MLLLQYLFTIENILFTFDIHSAKYMYKIKINTKCQALVHIDSHQHFHVFIFHKPFERSMPNVAYYAPAMTMAGAF